MRRAILILTAVLILLLGCTALWEASGCMFVGGKLCTVRTRELDLSGKPLTDVDQLRRLDQLEKLNFRNTGLTVEDYEELRAALPNCRIAWSVPFQGSTYPEDTTHLSVSSVSPEELHILAYFPALESLDATRCTDLNTIKMLMAARPDCKVDYVVPLEPALMEEARRIAGENAPQPPEKSTWPSGSRVTHAILGEGTVLGEGEGGVLVQFDRFVTPRTIAAAMLTDL